jgi:predicted secreted hydrolase
MIFSRKALAFWQRRLPAILVPAALPLLMLAEWQKAQPDYAWSFPRDHWTHRGYRTEWWYFTGQLSATEPPERRFGYQFTLFRVGLTPQRPQLQSEWAASDLIMGHAAITDLHSRRHQFSELLYREIPLLAGFNPYPDPLIAWCRGPAGTAAQWTLRWNGAAFDLSMRDDAQGMGLVLSTKPLRPLIFQGPNGYSLKSQDGQVASLYYSFTRLLTEGTVSLGGKTFSVQGQSWMDREFGSSQLAKNQVGWDWFSLQLDDQREIMLYALRNRGGAPDFARGTLVLPQGRVRYLDPADWRLSVTNHWKSPASGARYPARWTLNIPSENLTLQITPLLADQENRGNLAGGLFYWEGAVTVRDDSGAAVGTGYVELTGYGTSNRPPI